MSGSRTNQTRRTGRKDAPTTNKAGSMDGTDHGRDVWTYGPSSTAARQADYNAVKDELLREYHISTETFRKRVLTPLSTQHTLMAGYRTIGRTFCSGWPHRHSEWKPLY